MVNEMDTLGAGLTYVDGGAGPRSWKMTREGMKLWRGAPSKELLQGVPEKGGPIISSSLSLSLSGER